MTFEVGEKRFASSWCLVALIPAEILRFAQDDSTTVWCFGAECSSRIVPGLKPLAHWELMSRLKPRPTKLGQRGPTKPYQPTRIWELTSEGGRGWIRYDGGTGAR